MNDADQLDLTKRSVFRHWQRITIRSTDEDPLGHVNNCIYAAWIEVARVMLIRRYLAVAPDGVDTALVSMTIDFLKETGFPGEVEIGARLLGFGRTSLRSGFGVFRDGHCLATSRCVNVFFDLTERRAVPPTDDMREVMDRDLA
ncbi:MAG: acyl-CoA thioesterase [Geminicoccaceae bacterium]